MSYANRSSLDTGVYFAMARDGLFLCSMARIKKKTPAGAIVPQSCWTAVIALSGSCEQILNYAISMNFVFFGLSATLLFVSRRRGAGDTGESKTGFRASGHPLTTLIFIASCWLVVIDTIYKYPTNTLAGIAILLLGIPVYAVWH